MYRKTALWAELILIFFGLPALAALYPIRATVHAPVLLGAILALRWLHKQSGFSWKALWNGVDWPSRQRNIVLLRFIILTPLLAGLAYGLLPDRFFAFPTEHPLFWLVVMALYPILSVIPQEILFRVFFFHRYGTLTPNMKWLILINGLTFGWAHSVFHNPVSPLLCFIGGLMFAINYVHHQSLKWVTIEHALYGCLIFTVGLGKYFLVNPVIKV